MAQRGTVLFERFFVRRRHSHCEIVVVVALLERDEVRHVRVVDDEAFAGLDGERFERAALVAPEIVKYVGAYRLGELFHLARLFALARKRVHLGRSRCRAVDVGVFGMNFIFADAAVMHRHRVGVVARHVVAAVRDEVRLRHRLAFVVAVVFELPFCVTFEEMRERDEWVVDIIPNAWESDPKHIVNGQLRIPPNMWYIGTANNDDSTFAITDKVYDRAMPINIDTKGVAFDAPDTPPVIINYNHFEDILNDAKAKFVVSEESLKKVGLLDDYVIEHFRIAFGNRIVKQLRDFVPAYVGCGGTELDGLDYVLARKVFRKFESLNLSYIRDEIDGLCAYLDELFGEQNMNESKDYLRMLKKLV